MDEIGRAMSDLTEEVEVVARAILNRRTQPDWSIVTIQGITWGIDHDKELAISAIQALDAHRSSSGWRKSDNPIGEPVLVSASILEDAGDPVQPYVEFWYGNFVHRTYMPRALIHFPPSAKGMGDGG